MSRQDTLRRLILFTFIGSTTAPGILSTLHLSLFVVLPSILLSLSIVIITYYSVRRAWGQQGLYLYTKELGPVASKAFLFTWLISYYLYVIYTSIYIPYYVLNLDGTLPIILSVIIPVSVFSLVTFTDPLYAFPLIYSFQILFSLPLGWKVGLGTTPPLTSLFINILSSSLLLVCITLSTFAKGDKSKDSPFILYSFLISSIILLYGTFLIPSPYTVIASTWGNYGLILAELTAINNLLRPMASTKKMFFLNFAIIPLTLLGNLNYSLFYNTLLVPSVTFLYFSLLIFALSTLKIIKGIPKVFSLVSAFLFAFGEYNVLRGTTGILFDEALIAFLIGVLFIPSVYILSHASRRKVK
ncbi:hypothetical protein [Stygiolobus caldivivus]|uniref:Spore germination protein n=1 Tax=Stygiolobus caldivivus TaxID=2824673 RepID=A0A8D5U6F4_9CREN|nr:hypothetical protein [Stygiolobus caldivivus]BCU69699.1 hypothetical protein KN1_09960 [Stygiolobus caldivivus]